MPSTCLTTAATASAVAGLAYVVISLELGYIAVIAGQKPGNYARHEWSGSGAVAELVAELHRDQMQAMAAIATNNTMMAR
jgi:hypothetical protein